MKSLLAALAAALGAALGQAQVAIHVDEDFDAGIPPSWTVVDVTCPATNWHATSGGYKGNFLDGTEFAFIDSDAPGQFCWVEDYLVSPSFDASGAAALRIAFDHYFRFWSNGAGTLQVFDGAAWVDVITYKSTLGAWGAPDHVDLDLSA